MAEPEQAPASSSNPSPEPLPNFLAPESEFGNQEEPIPVWSRATIEWGVAWEIHLYGLGSLYIFITLHGIVSMLRLWHKSQKKVHIINLILLSAFGLSRALFLIIDGYGFKKLLSPLVANLLWGIGEPCIITAYSLLFLVLKNALVMKQRFKRWYTARNITSTAIPYFLIVCIAESTVAVIPSFKAFIFVCQFLSIFLTLLLLLFYSFVVRIIWKKKQTGISRMDGFRRRRGQGTGLHAIFVVCFMSILGWILLFISQIYGMAGIYGVFSNARTVSPWPWFIFNTIQRLLELYMCALLLWTLSLNSNGSSSDSNSNTSTRNDRSLEINTGITVNRHMNRGLDDEGTIKELNIPGSMPLETE